MPPAVISEPEFRNEVVLAGERCRVILSTDALWDVVTTQEGHAAVADVHDSLSAATYLAQQVGLTHPYV